MTPAQAIANHEASASKRMRLPDFIGIGAQRCGSTTLTTMLAQHERFVVSEPKEIHFFDDRDGHYADGIGWYAAHFAHATRDHICGEFTPNYLFAEGVAERIHAAVPNALLIAILRDPVARAWSHYWFNVRRGREPLSFERALEAEPERAAAGPQQRSTFSYVARGRYVEQLKEYSRFFPREQLSVIFFEELRASPGETLAAILADLGLDSADLDLRNERLSHTNAGVHPRSRRVHVAMTNARRWSAGRSAPVRILVRAIAGATRRVNLADGIPQMPPAIRDRLEREFDVSDRALADWLQRPIPWLEETG